MVHRVFNSAQYFFVKGHHVVNGGQYVNQMVNRVDYSAHMVNTALESIYLKPYNRGDLKTPPSLQTAEDTEGGFTHMNNS